MRYEKGSFLIVPNRSALIRQEPWIQSVYIWICSFADENGQCYPSRARVADAAGCSVKSVDRAIAILCDIGVLQKEPRKKEDGENLTNLYQIMVVSSVLSSPPSSRNDTTPSPRLTHELNPVLTESTYTSNSEELQIVKEIPTEVKKKADTTYRGVFELWGPGYPLNWRSNRTQIQAARNLLEEHGLDGVKSALKFAAKFADDPYCPTVTTPYDLDSKWGKLLAYKQKHS